METIFIPAPRFFEISEEGLTLKFPKVELGIKYDTNDIFFSRKDFKIGLSIKHNHTAVKHSRLSHKIDFGLEWLGNPCSESYWQKVTPIFDRLKILQEKN